MGLLLVLAVWAVAATLLVGLGAFVCGVVFRFRAERAPLTAWFWSGVLALLAVALCVHFVAPVSGWLWALLAPFAIAGLWRERPWRRLAEVRRHPVAAALALAAAAAWVGVCVVQAVRPATAVDDGLYFIQTTLWMQHFRVVPGLAALHPCLGHNQTYFFWVSSFALGPLASRPWVAANGLLLVASGLPGVVALARLLARSDPTPGPGGILNAILLAPLLDTVLSPSVSSPVADVAVLTCGVMLLCWLADALTRDVPLAEARWMIVLAAFATTLKQPFACVTIPLLLFCAVRRRSELRRLVPALAGVTALIAVWMAHGIILSGYPLYPLPLFGLNVDWRVPQRVLRSLTEYTFATHEWDAPSVRFGAMKAHWAAQWFQKRMTDNRLFVVPALALVSAWIGVTLRRRHPRTRQAIAYLLLSCVGLLVWWNLLPDERFAGALLWGAGFGGWALLAGAGDRATQLAWSLVVVLALVGGLWPLPSLEVSSRLPPPPTGREEPFRLPSGDLIWSGHDGLCFRLPCSLYPYPGLELRTPGHVEDGFRRRGTSHFLP